MRPRLVPRKYFLASGSGESDTSVLNAFDEALVAAGISQCNLVAVSSILPKGAKEVKPTKVEPGVITFAVMAKSAGKRRDRLTAGVSIGYVREGENHMIAELAGKSTARWMRRNLSGLLDDMASARGWKIERMRHEVCEVQVRRAYGVALAAVILML